MFCLDLLQPKQCPAHDDEYGRLIDGSCVEIVMGQTSLLGTCFFGYVELCIRSSWGEMLSFGRRVHHFAW